MNIKINGKAQNFEAPLNLYDVLEQQGYVDMMIAVARNGTFVAKDTYPETPIYDGDEIEIVAPMQGG